MKRIFALLVCMVMLTATFGGTAAFAGNQTNSTKPGGTITAKVYLRYDNEVPENTLQPYGAADYGPSGNNSPYFMVNVNLNQLNSDRNVNYSKINGHDYYSAQKKENNSISAEQAVSAWNSILACMSANDQEKFKDRFGQGDRGSQNFVGYVLKRENDGWHIDGILKVDPAYLAEFYLDGTIAEGDLATIPSGSPISVNDAEARAEAVLGNSGAEEIQWNEGNTGGTFTKGEDDYTFTVSYDPQKKGNINVQYTMKNNNFYLARVNIATKKIEKTYNENFYLNDEEKAKLTTEDRSTKMNSAAVKKQIENLLPKRASEEEVTWDGNSGGSYIDTDDNSCKFTVTYEPNFGENDTELFYNETEKPYHYTANIRITVTEKVKLQADYKVEHYLQKENGKDDYELDADSTATLTAEIGKEVSAEAKTYPNYTFNAEKSANTVSGTVVKDGTLVLKLYYDLNAKEPVDAEYRVEHYLQKENGKDDYELDEASTETLAAAIGTEVSAEANTYPNHTFNAEKSENIVSGTVVKGSTLVLKLYYDLKAEEPAAAGYIVKHYLQKEDDSYADGRDGTADEPDEILSFEGKVGDTVNAEALTEKYSEYEWQEGLSVMTGVVTNPQENGTLTLKVYYAKKAPVPPAEPTTEPTNPTTEPTEPATTEPATRPSEPTTAEPTEPTTKPTHPTQTIPPDENLTTEPTTAESATTEPTTTESATEPSEPTTAEPTEPVTKPSEPTTAEPTTKPTRPTQPVTKPTHPTQPIPPDENLPTEPTAAKPTEPQATEPATKPSEPTVTEPTHPTSPLPDDENLPKDPTKPLPDDENLPKDPTKPLPDDENLLLDPDDSTKALPDDENLPADSDKGKDVQKSGRQPLPADENLTNAETPQTGDDFSPAVWTVLLLAALAVLGITFFSAKRKQHKTK